MENKREKGFNTTDIALEFSLLHGEVSEAFDSWRKQQDDVGEELADIAIYLLGLAELLNIDVESEVDAKIAKNDTRTYRRLPNGTPVKAE
ncbi:MazG-like family protein [Salinactinospora qingdaonensis]|uniref:MazG-like family protein n=1 Tax=Salinactinospora qingdaonensis TaxID=702744 RepID=A0ABP7GIV9_9ACTN